MDYSIIFWSQEVKVGERTAFQISLSATDNIHISSVPFTTLAIYFNDETPSVVIKHGAEAPDSGKVPSVQQVMLGQHDYSSLSAETTELEANLRWQPGGSIILTGSLASDHPLTMSESGTKLHIFASLRPSSGGQGCTNNQGR